MPPQVAARMTNVATKAKATSSNKGAVCTPASVPSSTEKLGAHGAKVKHKRRFCRIEGCERIVKSQGLCQRHGAKPRLCKVKDCTKQAQGNFDGMCKSHFKEHKRKTTPIPKVEAAPSPPKPEGPSVFEGILPSSVDFFPSHTPTTKETMPLVAHLAEGFHGGKPPAWHRNEERKARGLLPVQNPATQLEGWERELVWMEILVLTGVPEVSFRHLARAWGRDKGFHMVLAQFICERHGDVQRKKRKRDEEILLDNNNNNTDQQQKRAASANVAAAAAAAVVPPKKAAAAGPAVPKTQQQKLLDQDQQLSQKLGVTGVTPGELMVVRESMLSPERKKQIVTLLRRKSSGSNSNTGSDKPSADGSEDPSLVGADVWDETVYGDSNYNEALAADLFNLTPQESAVLMRRLSVGRQLAADDDSSSIYSRSVASGKALGLASSKDGQQQSNRLTKRDSSASLRSTNSAQIPITVAVKKAPDPPEKGQATLDDPQSPSQSHQQQQQQQQYNGQAGQPPLGNPQQQTQNMDSQQYNPAPVATGAQGYPAAADAEQKYQYTHHDFRALPGQANEKQADQKQPYVAHDNAPAPTLQYQTQQTPAPAPPTQLTTQQQAQQYQQQQYQPQQQSHVGHPGAPVPAQQQPQVYQQPAPAPSPPPVAAAPMQLPPPVYQPPAPAPPPAVAPMQQPPPVYQQPAQAPAPAPPVPAYHPAPVPAPYQAQQQPPVQQQQQYGQQAYSTTDLSQQQQYTQPSHQHVSNHQRQHSQQGVNLHGQPQMEAFHQQLNQQGHPLQASGHAVQQQHAQSLHQRQNSYQNLSVQGMPQVHGYPQKHGPHPSSPPVQTYHQRQPSQQEHLVQPQATATHAQQHQPSGQAQPQGLSYQNSVGQSNPQLAGMQPPQQVGANSSQQYQGVQYQYQTSQVGTQQTQQVAPLHGQHPPSGRPFQNREGSKSNFQKKSSSQDLHDYDHRNEHLEGQEDDHMNVDPSHEHHDYGTEIVHEDHDHQDSQQHAVGGQVQTQQQWNQPPSNDANYGQAPSVSYKPQATQGVSYNGEQSQEHHHQHDHLGQAHFLELPQLGQQTSYATQSSHQQAARQQEQMQPSTAAHGPVQAQTYQQVQDYQQQNKSAYKQPQSDNTYANQGQQTQGVGHSSTAYQSNVDQANGGNNSYAQQPAQNGYQSQPGQAQAAPNGQFQSRDQQQNAAPQNLEIARDMLDAFRNEASPVPYQQEQQAQQGQTSFQQPAQQQAHTGASYASQPEGQQQHSTAAQQTYQEQAQLATMPQQTYHEQTQAATYQEQAPAAAMPQQAYQAPAPATTTYEAPAPDATMQQNYQAPAPTPAQTMPQQTYQEQTQGSAATTYPAPAATMPQQTYQAPSPAPAMPQQAYQEQSQQDHEAAKSAMKGFEQEQQHHGHAEALFELPYTTAATAGLRQPNNVAAQQPPQGSYQAQADTGADSSYPQSQAEDAQGQGQNHQEQYPISDDQANQAHYEATTNQAQYNEVTTTDQAQYNDATTNEVQYAYQDATNDPNQGRDQTG